MPACGARRGVAVDLADHGAAFADQAQRGVRERGEVAAGAKRAIGRHDRRDAGDSDGDEVLDDGRPGARGVAARQGRGAQQHHRAHDLAFERRTAAGGM